MRFVSVHPNGLNANTGQWPAMNPASVFELTANTGFPTVPPSLSAAVVLVARALYDGQDRVTRADAVTALCRPWMSHSQPSA